MALAKASQAEKGFSGVVLKAFVISCMTVFLCAFAAQGADAGNNPRYASIVMDADTGAVLYERSADKSLHPASLAKIMTLMLTFEAIENGDLTLRDRVVISRHAAGMVPSKLNLPVGSSIRVEDAIYALVTKSANDVAVALAERIAGTESEFALLMTRRAREIGMTGTRFKNASGLHNGSQVTTARDMAKLAYYVIRRYPDYYHYFSTRRFSYRGQSYHNHNRLMEHYGGMDGMKTGYIGMSGFNLVASAKRNNRRLIGVVFGGRTAGSRNAHMRKLLDEGFARLDSMLLAKNIPVPQRKPEAVRMAMVSPSSGAAGEGPWANLNPMLSNAFREMIGEGDYDPSETKRLETGLVAIAAVKGLNYDEPAGAAAPQPAHTESWAIQVGAFASRVRTDNAIREARESLPADLAAAAPVIVPLKTKKGWLFRGRLAGFSQEQAMRACRILKECLPVSPRAH